MRRMLLATVITLMPLTAIAQAAETYHCKFAGFPSATWILEIRKGWLGQKDRFTIEPLNNKTRLNNSVPVRLLPNVEERNNGRCDKASCRVEMKWYFYHDGKCICRGKPPDSVSVDVWRYNRSNGQLHVTVNERKQPRRVYRGKCKPIRRASS